MPRILTTIGATLGLAGSERPESVPEVGWRCPGDRLVLRGSARGLRVAGDRRRGLRPERLLRSTRSARVAHVVAERRPRLRAGLAAVAILCASGTSSAAGERLRIATTTSVEASGLLGALLPAFEKSSGISVEAIAVGSGKALKLAENGDVDAVLSHAPDLEEAFVRSGFGLERREVLENDFLIVGPPEDPAGIRGSPSAAAAFGRIAACGARFVSRGDESGTHRKEKELWGAAGASPPAGYVSAGLGMGEVLLMADEKRAYTLVDRATLAALRRRIDLAVLFEGDPALRNPYSVIVVNPARHPHVHSAAAGAFAAWLTSAEGQAAIAAFEIEGEHPFRPAARPGTWTGATPSPPR